MYSYQGLLQLKKYLLPSELYVTPQIFVTLCSSFSQLHLKDHCCTMCYYLPVFLRFDFVDRTGILIDRSYFIWIPKCSSSEVLVHFDGGSQGRP